MVFYVNGFGNQLCGLVDSDLSSLEDDRDCDAFNCVINEADSMTPQWIACDQCSRWFHFYCVGLEEPKDDFTCNYCNY